MEAILGFISNILTALFPFLFRNRDPSEFNKKCEKLRFDVAAALTMYSRCYNDPVDLAKQPNHNLPADYQTASNEIRTLATIAKALAATMPEKEKKPLIGKSNLERVSGCLIGLSNSMQTPYNQSSSFESRKNVRNYEAEIKELLKLR